MLISKILLTLIAIYAGIKFTKWLRRRRKLIQAIEKIPGPPNIPFTPILNHALVVIYLDSLRHKLGTFTLTYHVLSNMHRLFPDTGICRFWLGLKPVVVLYSPENVESILTSTNVINKSDEYRFFEPWIGEGLVTSKQSKWRFRRKILTPAFHFRILNDFLPIMNEEATKLIRKLNQAKYLAEDKVIDITPLIALCTLDTICETAMGVNINCQDHEQSEYVQALHEAGEMALSRVTRPWLWFDSIFYLTETGRRFNKANQVMQNFTRKVILERKDAWQRQFSQDDKERLTSGSAVNSKNQSSPGLQPQISIDQLRQSSFFTSSNKRLAFLDLMLYQHLIEQTMSIEDVREEVDTFMFAGHDTTAMGISWTLYMLGLHEDIQAKAREELDKIITDDEFDCFPKGDKTSDTTEDSPLAKELRTTNITIEQLREMKYLDRVIKEMLRMWPSIPFVARQMTEDVLVDNKYLVPEGATCMIFTQALHNNPKYYPKPEVFDPDRFLPENSIGRHPFAYIPFSAGPRNCIGQKFAQMEVKVILAKVIRNYYIKTWDHRDKLAVVGELVLRSRNGLNVKITPRFR